MGDLLNKIDDPSTYYKNVLQNLEEWTDLHETTFSRRNRILPELDFTKLDNPEDGSEWNPKQQEDIFKDRLKIYVDGNSHFSNLFWAGTMVLHDEDKRVKDIDEKFK